MRTVPEQGDELEELERQIRAGYEALQDVVVSKNKSEEKDSFELGCLCGRKEAVDRRLAQLPQLKVRAEIELRKLQYTTLQMRMAVLQKSVEAKVDADEQQQPDDIINAGLELIRQSEDALQALENEKAQLEVEEKYLAECIRSIEQKRFVSEPSWDQTRQLIAQQRRRILRVTMLKKRRALAAFQKASDESLRDQEQSLKALDHLSTLLIETARSFDEC